MYFYKQIRLRNIRICLSTNDDDDNNINHAHHRYFFNNNTYFYCYNDIL
jgi:hypothetical protein